MADDLTSIFSDPDPDRVRTRLFNYLEQNPQFNDVESPWRDTSITPSPPQTVLQGMSNNPTNPYGSLQANIIGTIFGGPGDLNPDGSYQTSAYTGQLVDHAQPGVALPYRFPAAPGQLPGRYVQITSRTTGQSVIAPVVDVGPHYTNNPYWLENARPCGEINTMNQSGLDMTPATATALGLPVVPGRNPSEGIPARAPYINTQNNEQFDWRFVPNPDE